ncbi:hypothetical protein [Paludisphaera rhizosphaerae]|uniref:hypothetical protein n=1 Tax=Paludisphaera rhizosphaerae TaxID=2711216 RepID=UPI001F115C8B|nr:hypothetical protein [Paludisphaera rhizosphaerae]
MASTGDRRKAVVERSVGGDPHPTSAADAPGRDRPRLVVPELSAASTTPARSEGTAHVVPDVSPAEPSRGTSETDAWDFPGPGRDRQVEGGGKPVRRRRPGKRAAPLLLIWAVLILDLQAVLWLSGVKSLGLWQAVEQGAARAESRNVGETADSQIQKAIRDQRSTLSFWKTLAVIDDFVIEPAAPAIRAVLAAVLLSAIAALTGRPIGFAAALDDCAAAQVFWVIGLSVQAALVFALRTPEVDVSAALFLPPGTYRATTWLALRQVEVFAVLGWLAMALGGWRRGQANLATSALACGSLAAVETSVRFGTALLLGGAMRLVLTAGR